jgi:hypothetical protein
MFDTDGHVQEAKTKSTLKVDMVTVLRGILMVDVLPMSPGYLVILTD